MEFSEDILLEVRSKSPATKKSVTDDLWFMRRILLEYGSAWEQKYGEFVPYYHQQTNSGVNDNTAIIFGFLALDSSEETEKETNDFWKQRGEEFLTLLADYRGIPDNNLERFAADGASTINKDDKLRYIYEILQNADDCQYAKENPYFRITLATEGMIVEYPEEGMLYSDVISLTTVEQSNKKDRLSKRRIGEKGIGFKSIFAEFEVVEIYSGGYSFSLEKGTLKPTYIKNTRGSQGTTLVLKKPMGEINYAEIYSLLKRKYGINSSQFSHQAAFQDCPILFTNHIKSMTVTYGDENFTIEKNDDSSLSYFIDGVKTTDISYFSRSYDCYLTYEEYTSRYPDQFPSREAFENLKNKEAVNYPIVLVAAKITEEQNICQGTLYSYLPTGTRIKAPLNIQLPVKLNLNRSCMDTEGSDSKDGVLLWNARFMNELYGIIPKFYKELRGKEGYNIFQYVPSFTISPDHGGHSLFHSIEQYSVDVKKLNIYCGKTMFQIFKYIAYFTTTEGKHCSCDKAVMFDSFIWEHFSQTYFQALVDKYQLEHKFLVPNNAFALKKTACFNFSQWQPENDLAKVELLNSVLSGKEEVVMDFICHSEQSSIYLPSNLRPLRIYKTKISETDYRYCSISDHLWFMNNEENALYSKGNICFYERGRDFPPRVKEWVKERFHLKYFARLKSFSQVVSDEQRVRECDDKVVMCAELFEEMMKVACLVATHPQYKDWYQYTKYLLLEKKELDGEILAEILCEHSGFLKERGNRDG